MSNADGKGPAYVPPPKDPAAHLGLLKARIAFFRDRNVPDDVAKMEAELAEIEAQRGTA